MTRRATTMAVLGDGGWGTTLAIHLHRQGHRVRWWGAFPTHLEVLARRRENVTFLPGIRIPRTLQIIPDLARAVESAELVIVAIPSQYLRGVVRQLRGLTSTETPLLTVAKGLEQRTLKRMSQVITEELGAVPLAVLSGPNIATEIAQGCPASSVVASTNQHLARTIQHIMASDRLRLYTARDVIGVELGGALKNPIAIAAGIGDGLKLGTNAKAALLTRGLVEMARLGVALGARARTFWGLSGLGDLVTTCWSGRNRWLGEQLGRGRSLARVLAATPMVFEGVATTHAALTLAHRVGVELPIIEQVQAILTHRISPRDALTRLMRRTGRSEDASSRTYQAIRPTSNMG